MAVARISSNRELVTRIERVAASPRPMSDSRSAAHLELMSPRPARPAPREYTPDAIYFGRRHHLTWEMPTGGNTSDLRLARQQHQLAWRLLSLNDPRALGRTAVAAGVARSTMSDYVGGRRWHTSNAMAAIALDISRDLDVALLRRPRH